MDGGGPVLIAACVVVADDRAGAGAPGVPRGVLQVPRGGEPGLQGACGAIDPGGGGRWGDLVRPARADPLALLSAGGELPGLP